ncbi:NusG domain II-containing protein [Brotaphodocola catenula]|uniref:NusG domain II-containing protein n=1 Tax=Brotaphodocola catenula TaxID=2885361 RepID=A0AAE3AP79_9FIRM|nr:NusG domain II-containing protein [Brotaphodocola catenula]MCC2164321.1 NusG domain II-containing protein [Brotaphodocola catenula]
MRKKTNLLITLALAVLCIGLLGAWMILRQKGNSQNLAEIVYQGELIRTVDLSSVKETETFTVGEPGAQNTIQISPDGIGVIEADCRDQICVKQGIRSHGPEPIVCLPHKLSIRFKDSTESSDRSEGTDDNQALDAVTGR